MYKGKTLKYLKDAPTYQLEMYEKHGPILFIKLGRKNIYIINDTDAIQQILVKDAKHFKKGMALQNAKVILGENILSSDGEAHLSRRKILSKIFSKSYVTQFETQINEYLDRKILTMSDQEIDLNHFFTSLSMDIISILLFGNELEEEINTIDNSLNESLKLIALLTIPGYRSILKLPLPHHFKFKSSIKKLNKTINNLIERRKKAKLKSQGTIDLLIEAGLSNEEIQSQVMALFLAGHETTATSLTWLFYCAMKHNAIDEKLLKEIKKSNGENISFTQLDTLPHVKALIYETYRFYPAVWNIGREVVSPIEILGKEFKKGDLITLSPFVMHRSSKFYTEPLKFLPQRWIDNNQCFTKPDKSYFFPFSHGTRNCIGKVLADAEIFSVIKKLMSNFDFELVTTKNIRHQGLITLKPKDRIKAKMTKRQS